MRNANLLPLCSLGIWQGEQLLGYLADKLNICGEKKKKLTLIYCSLIARCSATKLYKIANGYFFFFNLSFLVFVLSIVHLQFFSDSKFPPGSFV